MAVSFRQASLTCFNAESRKTRILLHLRHFRPTKQLSYSTKNLLGSGKRNIYTILPSSKCNCLPKAPFLTRRRQFSIASSKYQKLQWTCKETRFKGIIIDLGEIIKNLEKRNFSVELEEHLTQWKLEGKRGVWVKVPLEHSWAISDLYSSGFTCHHAKNYYIMMKKWLPENEENKMPNYAFHTVGVSGLVFNEDKCEALVVQDKGKITKWKFPGGFAEPNEDISETAVREVKEETGIDSEFISLLTFRQQHGMWLDQSDLYFICRLSPLSFDISMCPTEISRCEWLPLEFLLNSDDSTPLTKRVSSLILRGMQKGFQDVDILSEKMLSWVPPYNKTFKVFHRPLRS